MKPRLYESTETSFTSNGLGTLSDAMSCIVTEERNGPYELEMVYPITGIHFEDLAHSRIIWAIPADGKDPQPFRIFYISKPINGEVEVKADHISYQLSHIPVNPFTATTIAGALAGLSTHSAESNPFTFWTDKTTEGNFKVSVPSSIRSLLGGRQGSVLDIYGGGEYEFDKYTVRLYQNRGADNGVTLRYGKNITDITQDENIANTYTGVYPYWVGSNNDTEVLVTLPEKVLHSESAENFPYQRTIPLDLSGEFEEQPTEAQLRTRAQAYMEANNIGVPDVSIEVDFIALWQTEEYKDMANLERVNLCDTVTVEFPSLGISATAKVVKTEYDVLKERYNSIEVGNTRAKLTSEITGNTGKAISEATRDMATRSFLEESIYRATELITGGLGGHVVFGRNADGEPNEILIMDTDDIQTAVNVIRINQNGIGFSSYGYEGPFRSAWTIDGHFVADFIDTGTLNANLITAGEMSASRINGGILALGGMNNANGILRVLNSSGTEAVRMDNAGLSVAGEFKINSELVDLWMTRGYFPEYRMIEGFSVYYGWGFLIRLKVGNRLRGISIDKVMETGQGNNHYEEIKATYASGFRRAIVVNAEDGILDPTSQHSWVNYTGLLESFEGSNCHYMLDTMGNDGNNGWTVEFYRNHVPVYDTGSSQRFKHDIKPLEGEKFDPHRLLMLEPKQFIYNDDHPVPWDDMRGMAVPGFIAEDVAEIYPSATVHDAEGNIESWDERRIIPGMLALIQEQDREIKSLKKEIAKIKQLLGV